MSSHGLRMERFGARAPDQSVSLHRAGPLRLCHSVGEPWRCPLRIKLLLQILEANSKRLPRVQHTYECGEQTAATEKKVWTYEITC